MVSTAIPQIVNEFGSAQDVGWYASAYLLTWAAFRVSYAKLYSRFNNRIISLTAHIFFLAGSLACALAPSSMVLIVGRAIAGLGSAGLVSNLPIHIGAYETSQRPRYDSYSKAPYDLALVSGPLVGGVLADKLSCRW